MPQPQFDRIEAGRVRQFVDETFDGERIQKGADRAQRSGPNRQSVQDVMRDALIGEIVNRDRVALAGRFHTGECVDAVRLGERRVHVPGRQQRGAVLQTRPSDVRVAPQVLPPGGDALDGQRDGLVQRPKLPGCGRRRLVDGGVSAKPGRGGGAQGPVRECFHGNG